MRPHRFLLLLAASCVLTSSILAKGDREKVESPARVILFSGTHFTGERIELKVGEKIDDFRYQRFPSGPNANNRISSVRIDGKVEVSFYEYRAFDGDSITLVHSVTDLGHIDTADGQDDWNNNLSSVIVRERSSRERNGRDHDKDREGNRRNGGNDRDHDDRRKPAPRPEFNPETERIVRRAYLDILGREPDRAGLSNYVGILEDRGWSESRLRSELTRSTEYRTVVVPREITRLYREVLRREPDAAGLRFYSDRVIRSNWTYTRVRAALERSPEYRART